VLTEEQLYLQKNSDTYRRTKILIDEQKYLQKNSDTYRITMIFTKEHPPDGTFICCSVQLHMAIILKGITQSFNE
jgi:hypothetical protein